jgi:hypothetical protein
MDVSPLGHCVQGDVFGMNLHALYLKQRISRTAHQPKNRRDELTIRN